MVEQLIIHLKEKLGEDAVLSSEENVLQPWIEIHPRFILKVAKELFSNPKYTFDFLSSISGVDFHPKEEKLQVVYHLYSLTKNLGIVLKVNLPREDARLSSVISIWKTADWHERETAEMYGIHFENHPDLRKLLLSANWEGYPLRKDYQEQEYFHGIKVKY